MPHPKKSDAPPLVDELFRLASRLTLLDAYIHCIKLVVRYDQVNFWEKKRSDAFKFLFRSQNSTEYPFPGGSCSLCSKPYVDNQPKSNNPQCMLKKFTILALFASHATHIAVVSWLAELTGTHKIAQDSSLH